MTRDSPHISDTDPAGKILILNAGLRLFANNGLSATSIRDIADATGLSNPALYKHFRTKQELALVLFERLYRAHLHRLTTAIRKEPDFPRQFRAFIKTYMETYETHPDATMFTTNNFSTLWPDMPKAMKSLTVISLLRDLVESGRMDGLVNRTEDLDLQLSLILGMLGQLTRQLYFRTLPDPATKYVEGIERILRAGLS